MCLCLEILETSNIQIVASWNSDPHVRSSCDNSTHARTSVCLKLFVWWSSVESYRDNFHFCELLGAI